MASRYENCTVTSDFLDDLQIFTSICFRAFSHRYVSELEEHPARFAEVSESDVKKFIEWEENANTKKRPSRT